MESYLYMTEHIIFIWLNTSAVARVSEAPYAIGLLLWIAVRSRNLSGSHVLLNNMILSYLWKQEKNFIYFALFKTYYGAIELVLLTFAAEKKKWLKNMK